MLERYLDQQVVVDTDCRFTYVGNLSAVTDTSLSMHAVAVIDANESRIPVEQILVEMATHGVSPTRKSVWLARHRAVSITPVVDIIQPGIDD